MNTVLKIFLSMSFSGSLLILALLMGKWLLKDRISRQWQYYIWLIVILRLLLPFGPEANLMGKTYQAVDRAISRTTPLPQQQSLRNTDEESSAPDLEVEQEHTTANSPADDSTTVHPLREIGILLADHIWLVWLAAAMGLLIRKITIYQGFVRYINAGSAPVSDMELLDCLSVAAEQSGIKKPIELCINPLVSSPLLIGFFHPCIVLPRADVPAKDFHYIVLHELTHYKRQDMLYKWLVQVTVCLHWFNPFVHLMSREITRACEFSCDEAVLARMGYGSAQEYGQTLLDAMAAIGKYNENLGAVTLSENKQLLKERLGAIMRFKKRSKAVKRLTVVLTLCVVLGASFVGVYSVATAANASNPVDTVKSSSEQSDHLPSADNLPEMETLDFGGRTYYLVQNEAQLRAISTGGYGMDQNYMQQADIELSTDEWVPIGTRDNPFTGTFNGNGFEIIGLTMTDPYADIVGLFGVAKNAEIYNITMRDENITSAGRYAAIRSAGAILAIGGNSYDNTVYSKDEDEKERQTQQDYAEKAYADYNIASFSILTSYMDKMELERWLDRAFEDDRLDFQSVLLDKLDMGDEKDAQEQAWAEQQMTDYQAVGVTMEGKNYYYEGQLVNIFLDIRADQSFYTLDTNPAGTVNIKIIRDADDKITGVAYMTRTEAAQLFGELDHEG